MSKSMKQYILMYKNIPVADFWIDFLLHREMIGASLRGALIYFHKSLQMKHMAF